MHETEISVETLLLFAQTKENIFGSEDLQGCQHKSILLGVRTLDEEGLKIFMLVLRKDFSDGGRNLSRV